MMWDGSVVLWYLYLDLKNKFSQCFHVKMLQNYSLQVCCLQNRLYLSRIKGCGLENQTITSQSICLVLEESENEYNLAHSEDI